MEEQAAARLKREEEPKRRKEIERKRSDSMQEKHECQGKKKGA